MRGTLATFALATATLFSAGCCCLPVSPSVEPLKIEAGHPYWLSDNVPEGTPVNEAKRRLEAAGLTCVDGAGALLCFAREPVIVGQEGAQAMYVLQIRDGKVYQQQDPPQTKPYRTHGGII